MAAPVLSERVDKALREIGLTEYECQAYLSLLHSGGDKAEAISQLSNIPYTKVYSVLESLEERGWVQHSNGRPRIYYPRSPTDALRSQQLIMEKKFEYYQGIILEELQPVYEKKEIKEIPELWIVRGEMNSLNKIIELLEKASKEIMLAIPSISEEIRFTYPDLAQMIFSYRKKIMDSDVNVKVLTTKEMKPLLEMSDLGIAEVRICDNMFGGGVVIDGKETILFLDLVHPHGPDTAIWSEHETLTNVARIYFEYLWKNAHPWASLK
jgi:HTH-type transcriptional regulator, sugar sensing transcriptional regulator